ncbi:MAG: hypothetical protein GEU80_00580 [Dehalococcoidia bacterium]|nr:hypothetical protein [Dehalococcoidia bacterium]
MSETYWQRHRLGRRALIRGGGVGIAGLAGAALIGCGDDEEAPPAGDGGGGTGPASTSTAMATTPPDTSGILSSRQPTADFQPGGIYQGDETVDPESLDPLSATSFTTAFVSRWAYPQLMQFVPGITEPATGEVEGQLAETHEYADETTLILHLRTDAKWDERDPTNSRPVDAEDVVFSWQKFEAQSNSRQSLANAANENAAILGMEAVDEQTVRVTTAYPYGPLLASLAYSRWLQIMPVESDGGFDPRADIRGAGPWMLARYDRSVRFEWRKNPNFWLKDRPYLDGFDLPIIGEYAQRLAQFRAGNIYHGVVRQEDIISVKEEFPQLEVLQAEFSRSAWQLYFGLREGSPFRDERVRRAVSMLIDRPLIIDTFLNTDRFEEAGWPTSIRWPGVGVAAGYDAWWIDPQGEGLGEGAAAFQFNPDEAAKLIDAAVGGGPLAAPLHYVATSQYGTTFPRVGEAYAGLFNESGLLDLEVTNPDYLTEYLPNIYYGKGDFDGIAWGASTTYPVPIQHLFDYYHSTGARQKVAFNDDASTIDGQAAADGLIEQALRSLDFEEQVELVKQFQVENASRMPMVVSPYPGATPGFSLHWPWAENFGAYRDYLEQPEQTGWTYYWINEQKLNDLKP